MRDQVPIVALPTPTGCSGHLHGGVRNWGDCIDLPRVSVRLTAGEKKQLVSQSCQDACVRPVL